MRPLGRGTDHVAYLAEGDLVVRCVEGGDPAGVVREADVLAAVAEVSPLPVPKPVRVDPDGGCLAYERLPGTALLEVAPAARAAQASSVAGAVRGLLRALHAVPLGRARELVDIDAFPPGEWLREATQHYARISHSIPSGHRPAVEAFLEAAPPPAPDALALTHNDLGIEHVLVDPQTLQVTGVIDWADAAIADPLATWRCCTAISDRQRWTPARRAPTRRCWAARDSTPAAACSRTSPTASRTTTARMSTRACWAWRGSFRREGAIAADQVSSAWRTRRTVCASSPVTCSQVRRMTRKPAASINACLRASMRRRQRVPWN